MNNANVVPASVMLANTLEVITGKLEVVEGADRSVMSSTDKGTHTRTLKSLKADKLALEIALHDAEIDEKDVDTSEGNDDVFDALMLSLAVHAVGNAIGIEALIEDQRRKYTTELMELALKCEDLATWNKAMDGAYAQFQDAETPVLVPGSVKNARSVIKWGIVNNELLDDKSALRTFNALKKIKSESINKKAPETDSGDGEDGEDAADSGNTDLDIALQTIASLNQIAGEIKKNLTTDTLASQKAFQLRASAAQAIKDYRNWMAQFEQAAESEDDVIPDSVMDEMMTEMEDVG